MLKDLLSSLFFKVVTEAMEEWCSGVENKIINMHYSMIRIMQQYQVHKQDFVWNPQNIYIFFYPQGEFFIYKWREECI